LGFGRWPLEVRRRYVAFEMALYALPGIAGRLYTQAQEDGSIRIIRPRTVELQEFVFDLVRQVGARYDGKTGEWVVPVERAMQFVYTMERLCL
jgi:hypothetical protein